MTDERFRVQVQDRGGKVEARFSGELTIEAEDALTRAFRAADLATRPPVVIDFGLVPHANSAGIAALMGTLVWLRDRTAGITFVGLNRHLEKVFRMTGFPALVSM